MRFFCAQWFQLDPYRPSRFRVQVGVSSPETAGRYTKSAGGGTTAGLQVDQDVSCAHRRSALLQRLLRLYRGFHEAPVGAVSVAELDRQHEEREKDRRPPSGDTKTEGSCGHAIADTAQPWRTIEKGPSGRAPSSRDLAGMRQASCPGRLVRRKKKVGEVRRSLWR